MARRARLQILTVAELLDGRKIDMPPVRQVGARANGRKAWGTEGMFERNVRGESGGDPHLTVLAGA